MIQTQHHAPLCSYWHIDQGVRARRDPGTYRHELDSRANRRSRSWVRRSARRLPLAIALTVQPPIASSPP